MISYSRSFVPVVLSLGLFATSVQAQVRLNYDDLSSLEEPLAFEVGQATIVVSGVVDVPVTLAIDNTAFQNDVDVGLNTNFQVAADLELGNRWSVGVAYFGQYRQGLYDFSENATGISQLNPTQDGYNDRVAAYVNTSWGSLIGGNVAGVVREQTRRRRGVGNSALAFDDFYGGLKRWGGGYTGRFGPVVLSSVVDEDGDFQIGAEFQRPIGNRDFRVSSRVGRGQYLAADGVTSLDSIGVGAVGEVVFGSSLFDLGFGYENLKSGVLDVDRWFVSSGAQTKVGVISLSAAGHYGELDGSPEASASLGLGYDIARGLSTNLGINARKAKVTSQGFSIIDEDETTATASVRYSF